MNRLTATNRLNDGGRHVIENPQAADLSVDLTNSIIPRQWVGSVTYTRASIATITDREVSHSHSKLWRALTFLVLGVLRIWQDIVKHSQTLLG